MKCLDDGNPGTNHHGEDTAEPGDGKILLNWEDVQHERSIDHYRINYGTEYDNLYQYRETEGALTSYQFTGLINNSQYFFAVKAIDSEGRVIYVSTFSKIFAPGLRVGWVIANEDIIKYMGLAKQGMDLCTSPFAQYVALYALKSGIIEKRLPIISRLYKRKRDLMLKELENHLSDYAEWTKPVGGMFIFMWLPKQVDTKRMLLKAIKKYKIAYVPGRSFFVDGSGWNTMRLNFTYPSEEQIREGVKRLTIAIKDELKEIGVEQRV